MRISLKKRIEVTAVSFLTSVASGVFVPMNTLLKAEQVGFIVRVCGMSVLVASRERAAKLAPMLSGCPDLKRVLLTEARPPPPRLPKGVGLAVWGGLLDARLRSAHRLIDTDMRSISCFSGSEEGPKGVALPHRKVVAGAKGVADYLHNRPADALLAAPPLEAWLQKPAYAVFPSVSVRRDAEGLLYFICECDEMIRPLGYRVGATEVKERLYGAELVGECVTIGIDHQSLGQSIQVIAKHPTAVRPSMSRRCRRPAGGVCLRTLCRWGYRA